MRKLEDIGYELSLLDLKAEPPPQDSTAPSNPWINDGYAIDGAKSLFLRTGRSKSKNKMRVPASEQGIFTRRFGQQLAFTF